MSRRTDRFWRDRVALRYVDAHDAGDLEALADLWAEAETDPELEALLRELDEGLADEAGVEEVSRSDAAIVRDLARRHLPSGFPPTGPDGPLRAADVAARVRADPELWRRLDADGRRVNEQLITSSAPLPDQLGARRLARWGEGLGISGRIQYWDAFHKVAVRLRLEAEPPRGHRAAARPAGPAPGGEEDRDGPGR